MITWTLDELARNIDSIPTMLPLTLITVSDPHVVFTTRTDIDGPSLVILMAYGQRANANMHVGIAALVEGVPIEIEVVFTRKE